MDPLHTKELSHDEMRRLLIDARHGIEDARKHLREPETAVAYLTGVIYRVHLVADALEKQQ